MVWSTRALSEMARLGSMKQLRIGKGNPPVKMAEQFSLRNDMKFVNWPGIWNISELVCSFT